jgi:HK97 family phage prohead protease
MAPNTKDGKHPARDFSGHRVKSFQLFGCKADKGGRVITGHAAVFGNVDLQGEVIRKGAFAEQLSGQDWKGNIKLLWQHDPKEIIGIPVELKEDEVGLFFEAKVSNTIRGNEALELIADGAVNTMSIGYDVKGWEEDPSLLTTDGRPVVVLSKLNLWEISPVTFAANPAARILGVKAAWPWENKGGVWVPVEWSGRKAEDGNAKPDDGGEDAGADEWSQEAIDKLPDAAFAYIMPGGKADADGKTEPRNLRLFPHHTGNVSRADENESVDKGQLESAISAVPKQEGMEDKQREAALAHLTAHRDAIAQTEEAGKDGDKGTCPHCGKSFRVKAGRVLRKENLAKLREAHTKLGEVIASGEREEEGDGDGEDAEKAKALSGLERMLKDAGF